MAEGRGKGAARTRREFLGSAGRLGAGVLLSQFVPWMASAQAARTLRIGSMPILDTSQLWLALKYDFYGKYGLTTTFQNMAGGAVIAPAVEGGSLDIGWSNTVSLLIAHLRGFDFEFLMPGAYEEKSTGHIVHQILTAPNSGLNSVADLSGKTFAVNTLGNISELGAVARFVHYGVDPDEVRLVEVAYPDMVPAIMNRRVDAGLVIEPFVSTGLKEGARVLDNHGLGSLGDRYMIAGWFAKQSWVRRNRQLVSDFIGATMEAQEYYLQNPDVILDAITTYTRVAADVAREVTLPAFFAELNRADIQVLIDKSHEFGFIDRLFDAGEVISELAPV